MTRYRVTEIAIPLPVFPPRPGSEAKHPTQTFEHVQVIERWDWYWPFWKLHNKLRTDFDSAVVYARSLQGYRRHYVK